MSILDRYILKSMCVNYFIALGVMLSLYVLLDMFINLDEFTERDPTLPVLLGNLADYYGPNLTLYFAQLSGVIATFACLLTLARLRVQNELTAILASGVSLYRVAVPIVVFGVGTAGLLVLDTEVLVPALAPKLVRAHDEVGRAGQRQVLFMPDRDGALLSASRFTLDTEELHNLLVITRDDQGMATRILDASLATYEPPASPGAPGRWLLQRGRERAWTYADDAGLGPRSSFHERFPLEYVSDLSPRDIEIRQRKGWVRYLSLIQLRELQDKQVANLATHRPDAAPARGGPHPEHRAASAGPALLPGPLAGEHSLRRLLGLARLRRLLRGDLLHGEPPARLAVGAARLDSDLRVRHARGRAAGSAADVAGVRPEPDANSEFRMMNAESERPQPRPAPYGVRWLATALASTRR